MKGSYFDGSVLQLIGYSLLSSLLTVVTFGIAYPWATCMLQRWETKHTVIENRRLSFNGKGIQLLGLWVLMALLPIGILIAFAFVVRSVSGQLSTGVSILLLVCLLVFALCYKFFVQIQLKRWSVKHMEFAEAFSVANPVDIQAGPSMDNGREAAPPRPVEREKAPQAYQQQPQSGSNPPVSFIVLAASGLVVCILGFVLFASSWWGAAVLLVGIGLLIASTRQE